jgi:transketolase
MRDTFIKSLSELAKTDPRIMLITGDLGFGVLTDFAKNYPKQFLNAGVAEQNMTGLAAGLALEGRIVFTYSIANFPVMRCLEQIRNDVCYHNANVKIISIGGGFSYGPLGISHHATEDISIMRAMPDMTTVVPGDLWEAGESAKALINTEGACYLRLDKSHAPRTEDKENKFVIGKSRRLVEGKDLTLISSGGILGVTLEAAKRLNKKGISCRVISMHTLNPLDEEAILSASEETGGIITIEEQTVKGGLGGAVAEVCLEKGSYPKTFYRIGIRTTMTSLAGTQNYLRTAHNMDENAIVSHAVNLIEKKLELTS